MTEILMLVHEIMGLWINTKAPRVVQKSEIISLTEFAWFPPLLNFIQMLCFIRRKCTVPFKIDSDA